MKAFQRCLEIWINMKTSKEYDILIAISIVRLLKGRENVQDIQILQQHVEALVDNPKIVKSLYKIHHKSEA